MLNYDIGRYVLLVAIFLVPVCRLSLWFLSLRWVSLSKMVRHLVDNYREECHELHPWVTQYRFLQLLETIFFSQRYSKNRNIRQYSTNSQHFLRISYKFVMNLLWICYEFVMNLLWICYEFVINFLWISYEFLMNFLWISYEFLMNFLWISYKFLTNFLQIS